MTILSENLVSQKCDQNHQIVFASIFIKIKSQTIKLFEEFNNIKDMKSKLKKVGIFGPTGVGKSSLCNALFQSAIARVESIDCGFTRRPHEIFLNLKNAADIVLVDFPGVDENFDIALYEGVIQDMNLVLWLINSQDREYALGLDFYSAIIKSNTSIPVILVVTKIDRICDFHKSKLSFDHMSRVALKENDASQKLSIPIGNIISVSVKNDLYNVDSLESMIVDTLSA